MKARHIVGVERGFGPRHAFNAQEGTEVVPSELPSPPYEGENYGGKALKWVADQVRQGVLPDEALAEIQRDPASLSSILAYGEAAMAAGTLLSGGEGGEMPELRAFHGTNTEVSGGLRPNLTPDDQFTGISLHPDPNEAHIYASEKVAKDGGKPVVTEHIVNGNLVDFRELNDALGEDNFDDAKVTKWLKDNGYAGVDYTSDPNLGYGIRVMDASALQPAKK